jgi:integrase
MALSLYRRHRLECEGEHPEDSRSGEFQERSKKWKRCGCQIYAAGTLAGKFRRRRTGKAEWDEAKAVAAAWQSTGKWEGVEPMPNQAVVGQGQTQITVDRAVSAFLAEHDRNSSSSTCRKYQLLMAKLKSYSDNKGYRVVDQWTPVDVREFRDAWKVSLQTANRDMSVFRSFFDFCLANEWIDRNPATLVKNPKGKAAADGRNEQKLPFSDDELARMYECCETRYGKLEIKWKRDIHHHRAEGVIANYKYKWSGRDLADFITLSVNTGLRISDVATFHVDRLNQDGEVILRTTKTGTPVRVWVRESVQQMIRRRSLEVGPLIFGEHVTTDLNVITDIWRRKLKRLWRLCERDNFSWSAEPTPHRFRHTFARILLEQAEGVSLRDVAELLGNSEAMVRKHYAAWIPGRQERLTNVLRAAFQDRPRPGVLVEMPKQEAK